MNRHSRLLAPLILIAVGSVILLSFLKVGKPTSNVNLHADKLILNGDSPSVSQPPQPNYLGFDHIFVLNLKKRKDRLQKFEKMANLLGFNYTVVVARENEDPNLLQEFPFLSKARHIAYGVTVSHYSVMKKIVDDPLIHNALVLEDDVDFDMSTPQRLPEFVKMLPVNWEFFALYWNHVAYGFNAQKEGIYMIPDLIGAVAYAVSKNGAKKLIAAQEETTDMTWDILVRECAFSPSSSGRNLVLYSSWPILAAHWGSTKENPSDNKESRGPQFEKYETYLQNSSVKYIEANKL